ncbi:MAG: alpha/beta hydrolase family protein, partial [Planctomycetota bacterium]
MVSIHECFEVYERRFARVMSELPDLKPWEEKDKQEIINKVKYHYGIKDEWMPEIKTETVKTTDHDGFAIHHLVSESWEGVTGAAFLYVPDIPETEKLPLTVLCCGHGSNGKLTPGYQEMARHLVHRGTMVLALDNIGQGEREPMGHREVVAPFVCGTSLQGMITMETLAWIEWAKKQEQADASRMAAIGNSGGGHLTITLAALSPDLAAIASSGRPSTSEFTARKERKLCHCSLIPGVIGKIECWHMLGCFAPRPLYIFQGKSDPLFPFDLFHNVARKVRTVYSNVHAEQNFKA